MRLRLSLDGAARVEGDLRRVGEAATAAPQRIRAGVESISSQLQRLQNLWLSFQGLQLFGVGVRELAQMADAFTSLNARLALVTGSGQAASTQFGRLLEIANRMQQPVQEVGQLYIGLARSADNLGASQQQMTHFTEGVAASLRVSGTSSQAAAGALLQLSQMMAGTNVQAQEFNSLIDGAPELLRVVAANLDGTGVTMGELRKRVLEGKLSTKELFEAFLKGADALIEKTDKLPPTIGGALTEIRNNALKVVGGLDRAMGGMSTSIAQALRSVAKALPGVVEPMAKFLDLTIRVGPYIVGYLAVMKAAPFVVTAFTVAKTALTGAVVRFQLAAAISGSTLGGLSAAMATATAGTLTLTTAVTRLQLAFSVLVAAFAGWQIGTWMRENFVEAQLAGIAFVNVTARGWEHLKFAATAAWAIIKAAWRETLEGMGGVLGWFLDRLADGLSALGLDSAADKLRAWASRAVDATENADSLASELVVLKQEYERNLRQVDEITDAMADEAIATFQVTKALDGQAEAARGNRGAKTELTEAQKKLADSMRAELDKLKEANATFGMGEDAVLAYRAAKEGLGRATEGLRGQIAAERAEIERKTKADAEAKQATKDLEDATLAAAKARDESFDTIVKETTALEDAILKQRAENDVLRGVKDAVFRLEQAKLEEMATSAERAALVALERDEDLRQYEAFKQQAAKLRELAALKGEGVHLEMAKQSADEWTKTTDSIADGLTDALMRGFEAGKGFGRNLLDVLKNAFKTTVLQPTIKAIMAPVSGAIGSLFGGPAMAGQSGGGGGGILGSLGNLPGLSGMLGSFGSFAGTGIANLFAGGAGLLGNIGTGLSAAGSLMGSGSIMSGLGMAAGTLGPIALGLMALNSLRHKVTPHVGGSAFANASGVTEALNSSIGFGLANHDRAAETVGAVKGVAGSSAQALNALALAFGGAADFGVGAGFADDTSKDGAWGHLRITRAGQILRDWQGASDDKWPGLTFADGEEGWKQYGARVALDVRSVMEQIDMPAWAQASLDALGEGAGLDQLIATAEQIAQTKLALEGMAEALRPMGGIFGSIRDLSSDAQHQLAAFAGGIEALASKAASFVQAYYTADEQAAVSAASIAAALTGAGLDISGLDTKAEYRTLLESRDLTSEVGRKQFAALLDASGAFAQLSDYLGENNTALDVLAGAAPALIALPQVTAQANAAAGLSGEAIDVGLAGVVSAVTSSGDSIVAELQAVRESLEAGLAQVASNTASAARDLVDLNNVIGEGA